MSRVLGSIFGGTAENWVKKEGWGFRNRFQAFPGAFHEPWGRGGGGIDRRLGNPGERNVKKRKGGSQKKKG